MRSFHILRKIWSLQTRVLLRVWTLTSNDNAFDCDEKTVHSSINRHWFNLITWEGGAMQHRPTAVVASALLAIGRHSLPNFPTWGCVHVHPRKKKKKKSKTYFNSALLFLFVFATLFYSNFNGRNTLKWHGKLYFLRQYFLSVKWNVYWLPNGQCGRTVPLHHHEVVKGRDGSRCFLICWFFLNIPNSAWNDLKHVTGDTAQQ